MSGNDSRSIRGGATHSAKATKQPPLCKYATVSPQGCTDEWCSFSHPNRPVLCFFESSVSGCTNKINCKYFHPSNPRPVAPPILHHTPVTPRPPKHFQSSQLLPHGSNLLPPKPFQSHVAANYQFPIHAPGARPPARDNSIGDASVALCRFVSSSPQGCTNEMCKFSHPGRPLLCQYITSSTGCTNNYCGKYHPRGIKKIDPSPTGQTPPQIAPIDWKTVEELFNALSTFDIARLPSSMVNILMDKADSITVHGKPLSVLVTRLSNTSIKILGTTEEIVQVRRDLCAYSVSITLLYLLADKCNNQLSIGRLTQTIPVASLIDRKVSLYLCRRRTKKSCTFELA